MSKLFKTVLTLSILGLIGYVIYLVTIKMRNTEKLTDTNIKSILAQYQQVTPNILNSNAKISPYNLISCNGTNCNNGNNQNNQISQCNTPHIDTSAYIKCSNVCSSSQNTQLSNDDIQTLLLGKYYIAGMNVLNQTQPPTHKFGY